MDNLPWHHDMRHIRIVADVNETLKSGMVVWLTKNLAESLIDQGKAEQYHASIFEYYVRRMNSTI